MEPCIYQGCIQRRGNNVGSAILIAYVDDWLLCSDSDAVEKVVEETIGAVVPLKESGKVKKAENGGGSLVFIGRHIYHGSQANDLRLGVDPKFLDSVFKEYGITKGSQAVPDVAAHIEKTVDDANSQVLLSPESYSRFRRALGNLLPGATRYQTFPFINWFAAGSTHGRHRDSDTFHLEVSLWRYEHSASYTQ